MKKTSKIVYIGLLVAQALVLHIIERMIPVPFITPGAKLGLANLITVIALYTLDNKKDAFLLHSVGHMNKGWEVDASISYADYYYLEALVRLKRLKEKQSVLANL